METSLWKLGNPLLAVSPWSSQTWFLALAPLCHGLQVAAMIGLLIAATQVDQVGGRKRQIDVAPSYVRWSAINIVRLSCHVVLESWLVYRRSRRYVPQPWLIANVDVEANENEAQNEDVPMQQIRPRDEARVTVPTPHIEPSPSRPLSASTDVAGAAASATETGQPKPDEEKPDGQRRSSTPPPAAAPATSSSSAAAASPAATASAGPATHTRAASTTNGGSSSSAAGSSSTSARKGRRARRAAARERDAEDDRELAPDETAAAVLAEPPAPVAALTTSALAEAAKRRADRLRRWDQAAANLDLWVCMWGFLMWVVGIVIVFPVQPAATRQPLVFGCVMAGLASSWFTCFGFAVCLLLWSAGYVLILGAWALWHLGLLRGAQPALFARASARRLPRDELDKCPLVVYAADPGEDEPVWDDPPGRPLPLAEIDAARLPHPLRVLPQNRATCGICHAEFVPPCAVAGSAEYELEVLRELPCAHTFHRECVDEWLLNHADTCPYCTQSVRDMLKNGGPAAAAAAAPSAAGSEAGAGAGAAGAATGAGDAAGPEPPELLALRRTMSRRRSQRSVRSVRSRTSARSPASAPSKSASASASVASVASRDSAEMHDSRATPAPAPRDAGSGSGSGADDSRAPSTAYETAASSALASVSVSVSASASASFRTATPGPPRADSPLP